MVSAAENVRILPPLILHPFADAKGPSKLVESSRAGLMLQGLLPKGEFTIDELEQQVLAGRYSELGMLFYIGRDLARWLEQCMDAIGRTPGLAASGVSAASFAHYLVEAPPEAVKEKLRRWGVVDQRSIFVRALGINALFSELPPLSWLNPDFIRSYFSYAESAYAVRLHEPYVRLDSSLYSFEIYASGEYSRMLERSWDAQ